MNEASRHTVPQVPKHAEISNLIKKYSTSFVQKILILSRLTETDFFKHGLSVNNTTGFVYTPNWFLPIKQRQL
jgi:hypothetical protein